MSNPQTPNTDSQFSLLTISGKQESELMWYAAFNSHVHVTPGAETEVRK